MTDFKKASDLVDNGLLIATLSSLVIGYPLIPWLSSYLKSRRQFVFLNGAVSKLSLVSSGVPQGGYLILLIFIIFVHSINKCFSFARVLLFANDIKMFCKMDFPADILLLQAELDVIFVWTHVHHLTSQRYYNSPDLLTSHYTRHHCIFSVPTHLTSYGHNQSHRKMLRLFNQP